MSSKETKDRLRKLTMFEGNKSCADCKAPRPTWTSLIVLPDREEPVEDESIPKMLGTFICFRCSAVQRGIGSKFCNVKTMSMDKCKFLKLECWTVQSVCYTDSLCSPTVYLLFIVAVHCLCKNVPCKPCQFVEISCQLWLHQSSIRSFPLWMNRVGRRAKGYRTGRKQCCKLSFWSEGSDGKTGTKGIDEPQESISERKIRWKEVSRYG